MTDEIDYNNDDLFPTRGLIPEVDKIRDRKIKSLPLILQFTTVKTDKTLPLHLQFTTK